MTRSLSVVRKKERLVLDGKYLVYILYDDLKSFSIAVLRCYQWHYVVPRLIEDSCKRVREMRDAVLTKFGWPSQLRLSLNYPLAGHML